MELAINLVFPFNGNTDEIIIYENYTFEDLQDYIFETYNIENFKIVSNSVELTKNNFKLYDNMSLSIIPCMKSGRNINRRKNQLEYIELMKKSICTCGKCFSNSNRIIPNKESYISPDITSKYVRNLDKDELENLGKKFKIAMEEEYKREQKEKKENQNIHEKIMDIRDKVRESKARRKLLLSGVKKPKNPEKETFCGFKKGFLL